MAAETSEHTVEVLREAGADEAEFARPLQSGIIVHVMPE